MSKILNWLCEVFGTDENTSATILITVLVFGAGILSSMLIDFLRTWRRRNMLKSMVKLNIDGINRNIRNQGKGYRKTASQFSFDRTSHLTSTRIELSEIEILKEIGYDQIYQAYFFGFIILNYVNEN
jgi:hypothetical protein